ncbi:hypothetical protein AVEN_156091-1 [Araneus ventricosus]|uniref:PiggyBac transposable element-derived protein domain-containing protein n=1 Tax=Araneus ventricosus TaxID=182803 RepID=A0A4Y2K2E2_ARAVE|nr:hypothetical protein AVEN_156091-1 [Araneus ventricosus]
MARKFLTAEEALEYMNSLSDEEFDDPEIIIIPQETDAVSDEEEIDDSIANCNIVETCSDPEIRDTAGTIEVLSNICEETKFDIKPPKWKKCEPEFSLSPYFFSSQDHQHIADKISGNTPVERFHTMANDMISHTVTETNRYAVQKNDHSFSVNESDIKKFIGILFYSGYHILPREKMY